MISTAQGGPKIITDGLDMYLDAANVVSYPGAGTTWFDLSGNRNNFTLTGAPTNTGLAFNFNGTSQYATCVNTTCGNYGSNSFTIEHLTATPLTPQPAGTNVVIMKRTGVFVIGGDGIPGWCDRIGAGRMWAQDNNPGGLSNDTIHTIALSTIPTGSYVHVAYVIERNGADITGSRYINGVYTATSMKTLIGTLSVDNAAAISVMNSYASYTTGSISLIRLYNRNLTAAEVLQNYNATKARFTQ